MLFLKIFRTSSLPNRMSQGPEMLRKCSPPFMCHMSHVMCHMSRVTCHVSHVACHMSHVTCHIFFDKVVNHIGGGSVINGAYPVQFSCQRQIAIRQLAAQQANNRKCSLGKCLNNTKQVLVLCQWFLLHLENQFEMKSA